MRCIAPASEFDSLYAVRSGFFKSSVVLEDGRDQVTGFHMAGEILGMDGIGTDTPRGGRDRARRQRGLRDPLQRASPIPRCSASSTR